MVNTNQQNSDAWADAQARIGLHEFSHALRCDIKSDKLKLREIGLPVYDCRTYELSYFVLNTSRELREFGHPVLYYIFIPKSPGHHRYSDFYINNNEQDFRKLLSESGIGEKDFDKYFLVVSECEENVFGGSLINSDAGDVIIEMKLGDQVGIGRGFVPGDAIFFGRKSRFENVFRYNMESPQIRQILFSTWKYTGGLPGYFEFALTSSMNRASLRTVFFDYRDNPVFRNIDFNPTL